MSWWNDRAPGTLDTDLTDEKAWQMRPELAAKSKARMEKEAKAMAAKVKADKAGVVKASVTTLDTDHTDEVAWNERKVLAQKSRDRRAARQAEIDEQNRKYREMVRRTKSSDKIDDDLRDEEEWQVRPDLVVASAARKEAEKDDLAAKNREYFARVRSSPSRVMDISKDGFQKAYPDEPERVYSMYNTPWDNPPALLCFKARDKELFYGTQSPYAKEKFLSYGPTVNPKEPKADQVGTHEINDDPRMRKQGEGRPPTWLKTWESYDFGAPDAHEVQTWMLR